MSASSEPQPPVRAPLWKRLLQNLALMTVTFVLCFVVLEVALRLAGYGNVEIYEPDPQLYWRLKPNQDCYTKIDHKPVHINAHGTRGPDFTDAKPPGTYRILSLGDSRTFGWGLTEAESYSGLIEEMLQEHVGKGRRIEVINAGVNAWSYAQMYVYFRDYGLKYHPDVVILAEANLWTQFSENNSPEFVKSFMRRVWLKNFLRRFALYHYIVEYKLKELYERQRVRFIPVDPKQDTMFKEEQAKDPDAFFREYIERLCSLARSNNVQPVLLHLPTLQQMETPESDNVLRVKSAVSEQLDVPQVDLTLELKPKGKELYLEGDPVHLNVAGNLIIAQRLYTTLTNLVTP